MTARRVERASAGEWRDMAPPRRNAAPEPSTLTLRSLIAGVILMTALGIVILAGAQMLIELAHWLRGVASLAMRAAA